MMPDVALSGLEWLNRITFDGFYHIVWFLDVQSVLMLASTCEAFQEAINESKVVWLRVLRVLSFERSIPPHSFENLTSSLDLKAAATRYLRMTAALVDHRLPLAVRVDRYLLDHSGIFDDASAMLTPPTLLPGGRWLLSLAYHGGSSYVICWDIQHKSIGPMDAEDHNHSLQPAAYQELKGLKAERVRGSWASVQATPNADSVIIATRASNPYTGMRAHHIIQLSWSERDSTPTFVVCAELDNDIHYLPDDGPREYTLEGDYLVIDSFDGILVWNWKDDTVCTIDPEKREWADGSGFLLSPRPPFLFVIPHELRHIVTIPIPTLVPRSSRTVHLTPVGSVDHPFLKNDLHGLSHSALVPMNRWQSVELRPDVNVLTTYRTGAEYVHNIIRFSSADGQIATPRRATQSRHRFKGVAIASINVISPSGDAIVCELLPRTRKARRRTPGFELKVHAFSQHSHGHFLPSHSRIFVLDDLSEERGWIPQFTLSGPICPVSGSMLLAKVNDMGLLPVDAVSVAIAHFD